jgi:hypothetical protein
MSDTALSVVLVCLTAIAVVFLAGFLTRSLELHHSRPRETRRERERREVMEELIAIDRRVRHALDEVQQSIDADSDGDGTDDGDDGDDGDEVVTLLTPGELARVNALRATWRERPLGQH